MKPRKTCRVEEGMDGERPLTRAIGFSPYRAGSAIVVATLLGLLAVTAIMPTAWAAKVPTSARISPLSLACTGISVTGTGYHQQGIRSSDFTLIDTTKDPFTNLVDSKYFSYTNPLPKQVTESWTSGVPLTPGTAYRVFFHIWDTTGQYWFAALDFTCS